jgi:carboxylesterase
MYEVRAGCDAWSCEGSGSLGDTGILVVHGFTGSPASMRPLAEDLAARGFSVELPRLPGHGTHVKDLMKVRWQDLARETVGAFERLRARTKRQIAVGLSVGGLLSLRLAQTRGDDLAGLVLINPFLGTDDPKARLLPILRLAIPSFPGVINDIAKPDQDEIGYDRLPLRALHSITQLQKQVVAALPDTHVPTLLLTSRKDNVLGTFSSTLVPAKIGAADFEHIWLERSHHVATLDYDYDTILEATVKLAERVGSASA